MYKVMDLFCGTGGFSKGLDNTKKFDVVFRIDVLSVAVEAFEKNHKNALSGLNEFLICGGPILSGY